MCMWYTCISKQAQRVNAHADTFSICVVILHALLTDHRWRTYIYTGQANTWTSNLCLARYWIDRAGLCSYIFIYYMDVWASLTVCISFQLFILAEKWFLEDDMLPSTSSHTDSHNRTPGTLYFVHFFKSITMIIMAMLVEAMITQCSTEINRRDRAAMARERTGSISLIAYCIIVNVSQLDLICADVQHMRVYVRCMCMWIACVISVALGAVSGRKMTRI